MTDPEQIKAVNEAIDAMWSEYKSRHSKQKQGAAVKSKRTTYEFDLDTLKELLAREIGVVPDQRVTVRFVMADSGDDRFGPVVKVCTGVELTVEGKP